MFGSSHLKEKGGGAMGGKGGEGKDLGSCQERRGEKSPHSLYYLENQGSEWKGKGERRLGGKEKGERWLATFVEEKGPKNLPGGYNHRRGEKFREGVDR